MMSNSDTLTKLLEILRPYTKEGQTVGEETEIVAELGLDSMQVMQLLLKIEDEFDISIPLNNVPHIQTVKELTLEVERLLQG